MVRQVRQISLVSITFGKSIWLFNKHDPSVWPVETSLNPTAAENVKKKNCNAMHYLLSALQVGPYVDGANKSEYKVDVYTDIRIYEVPTL